MTRGLNRDDSCWHCGGDHFTSECQQGKPKELICHVCLKVGAHRDESGSIRRCGSARALCSDCSCDGSQCLGVWVPPNLPLRAPKDQADAFAERMKRRRAAKHLPTKEAIAELRMARVQAMLGPSKKLSPLTPTDTLQEPLCLELCPWDEETPCARSEGHTGMHYGLNGSAWPGVR